MKIPFVLFLTALVTFVIASQINYDDGVKLFCFINGFGVLLLSIAFYVIDWYYDNK